MKDLMTVADARATLIRSVDVVASAAEMQSVRDARGRVSAEAIAAPMDVPPFAASAMDGYAVCSHDPVFSSRRPHRLRVCGESLAGRPLATPLPTNGAVRIFTGAALPPRADSIVIQENASRSGDEVTLDDLPAQGRWVRHPGHDVRRGTEVVPAGRVLGAFDLAALAACGIDRLPVRPLLRVAVFSTGDELREPPALLAPGQIYDCNRLVLRELLADCPVVVDDLGILADEPELIARTIDAAARSHDALLTSGGVSVGEADHVRAALDRVGRLDFWKVAIRPGKPFAFGRAHDCAFFGLPGNPVSAIVTFLLLVKPALDVLAGASPREPIRADAIAATDIEHEPGRTEYQRGRCDWRDGALVVTPSGDQSSNRIAGFADTNCLIELEKENPGVPRGARVQVLPFRGLVS
jgi:molybdopterin molybdotransferase